MSAQLIDSICVSNIINFVYKSKAFLLNIVIFYDRFFMNPLNNLIQRGINTCYQAKDKKR